MEFTTVTKTSVKAAEFFAGIKASQLQSDGSSRCSVDSACVATKPCGVIQMAFPITTIKNPTLITVRDDTVSGTKRPNTTGIRINGISTASDFGSGAGKS